MGALATPVYIWTVFLATSSSTSQHPAIMLTCQFQYTRQGGFSIGDRCPNAAQYFGYCVNHRRLANSRGVSTHTVEHRRELIMRLQQSDENRVNELERLRELRARRSPSVRLLENVRQRQRRASSSQAESSAAAQRRIIDTSNWPEITPFHQKLACYKTFRKVTVQLKIRV